MLAGEGVLAEHVDLPTEGPARVVVDADDEGVAVVGGEAREGDEPCRQGFGVDLGRATEANHLCGRRGG